jgi:hypothetical protein
LRVFKNNSSRLILDSGKVGSGRRAFSVSGNVDISGSRAFSDSGKLDISGGRAFSDSGKLDISGGRAFSQSGKRREHSSGIFWQ